VRRVLPAWVPPGRLPIRAEGDDPKSDDGASGRGRPTRDGPAPVNRCAPNDPLREDVRPPHPTSDPRGAHRYHARARARASPRRIRRLLLQRASGSAPRPRGRAFASAPARDSIAAERELRSGCRVLREPVLQGQGHRRPWQVRSPFCPRHVHSAEQSGAHPGAQSGSHSWLDPSKGRVGRGQGPW
jgi:hypothetical protein